MFPFIIKIGEFTVPSFFFMVMVGVLALTFYLYFRAPKLGFSQLIVLDCGIVGAISGILGARIFHILFEHFPYYAEDPIRVFYFWQGGFVSFGAFIGGATAVLLYLKWRKVNILEYADFIAAGLPLLVIFIRIGCLGAGCCFGKPTDFFFHLTFTDVHSDAGSRFNGVHLHATQIYNMLNGLFLLILLNWRAKYKKFSGEIVLLFFMLYPIGRGLVEFLRGDTDRGVYFDGTVSTGQIVGLIFISLASALYVYLIKRASKTHDSSS